MQKNVTIPREEYEKLLRFKKIVESDFEEDFSEEFIKAVLESEKAYKRGEFVRCKSKKERKELFDSL